ncbi:MAG: hypothetical protein PHI12_07340 [Dehalococcoidales bacterium]|nr:hypothetical protein [Dehalococcoidales bacterium]
MAIETEKYAAVVQTLTALGIGALLFKGGTAKASTTGEYPPEVIQILQALATGMGTTIEQLNDVLTAIRGIPGGEASRYWPENADYETTVRVQCIQANVAYQVPSLVVPDGFEVLVKAYPTNGPLALIFVITNPAPNQSMAYPLLRNETRTMKIKDTGKIYLFTDTAGSQATVTVEQRSGG